MTDHVHHDEANRWGGWEWRKRVRGEHFRRCSYCGSIHPDDLVAEADWTAEWADRKYGWPHKFYVNVTNQDPARVYVVGVASYVPGGDWIARGDLTRAQRRTVKRDGYELKQHEAFQFGTHAHHFGKFYTAHLADPAISDEVKEKIYQRCGLRFTFADTQVTWERVQQ